MDLSVKTLSYQNDDQRWLGSARGTNSARPVTLKMSAFTSGTHYVNGYLPSGTALAVPTSGTNSGYAVPVAARPTEAQTVTITGTPTGGTVTLTLDGETTATIAYNATAATVQTALEGLSNVSVGDVAVTGGPGPGTAWVVTFGAGTKWAGKDVPQMTASGASLTGGTSPAIAVTTTTAGGSGVTDGSDELAGFLLTPQQVLDVTGTAATTLIGPMIDTGRIVEARLPVAISAAVKATNPRFTFI